jgi:hypothetical protein
MLSSDPVPKKYFGFVYENVDIHLFGENFVLKRCYCQIAKLAENFEDMDVNTI